MILVVLNSLQNGSPKLAALLIGLAKPWSTK